MNNYKNIAATITPCRAPGEVDFDAAKNFYRALLQNGCDGLFVVGSTGGLSFLDAEQRRAVIKAAATAAEGRAQVYAGVSGTGAKQILDYARDAADAGADVAVVMAPFFLKLSQRELTAYIEEIADASPLPLALYHHVRAPSAFEIETVAHLAQHPNISAMKDSSSDLERVQELVAVTKENDFVILQGSEKLIAPSLQVGAHGSVTAVANVVPDWHRALMEAFASGDVALAQEWQERIAHLAQFFGWSEVLQSFICCGRVLRMGAQWRGWLNETADMVQGFVPEEGFEAKVRNFFREIDLPQLEPAYMTH